MEELSVLIEKSQAGDKETRSILIENNLGLVHHIVKRFAGRGYETEDLFQIGVIGLMKAIDKFDLTYDVKFSTYAVPMMFGCANAVFILHFYYTKFVLSHKCLEFVTLCVFFYAKI